MDENMVYDWDDDIDGFDGESEQEFVILPEGKYRFEITGFERGRFEAKPDSKIPSCNKAIVTFKLTDGENTGYCTQNFFLAGGRQKDINARLFKACGLIPRGTYGGKFPWGQLLGSEGECKAKPREYTAEGGEKRKTNNITFFYMPGDDKGAKEADPWS